MNTWEGLSLIACVVFVLCVAWQVWDFFWGIFRAWWNGRKYRTR